MAEPLTIENVRTLNLSELIASHMLEPFAPDVLVEAQELFVKRVVEGQEELFGLYNHFRNYLGLGEKRINPFTDYLKYLQYLYEEKPRLPEIDKGLRELDAIRAPFVQLYVDELSPRARKHSQRIKGGIGKYISEQELYLEAVESDGGPNKKKKAALIMVRRKDIDRAIAKIAYRILKNKFKQEVLEESISDEEKKSHLIDDYFGLKVVTYNEATARDLAEEIYHSIGKALAIYAPSENRVARYRKGTTQKLPGTPQRQGWDDHYLYGCGSDHLLQIKLQKRFSQYDAVREIVLTDVVSMLVDEVEHLKFRFGERTKLEKMLEIESFRKQYIEMIERGEELQQLLPKKRKRILLPGIDF